MQLINLGIRSLDTLKGTLPIKRLLEKKMLASEDNFVLSIMKSQLQVASKLTIPEIEANRADRYNLIHVREGFFTTKTYYKVEAYGYDIHLNKLESGEVKLTVGKHSQIVHIGGILIISKINLKRLMEEDPREGSSTYPKAPAILECSLAGTIKFFQNYEHLEKVKRVRIKK